MAAKRTEEILRRRDEVYGTEYICYLNHETPWQLLIAVILSAQCTDARVNIVTKDLFVKYDSLEKFANADLKELEHDIKPTGFFHNKAKNIIACAKRLIEVYGGEVPSELEDLLTLAGVGRKTANVIASVIYDKPVIAVDTHVFRVSRRLGLSDGTTVEAVEKDLTAGFAPSLRPKAHHWLILHGRYVCTARKPKCAQCGLKDICREYLSENVII